MLKKIELYLGDHKTGKSTEISYLISEKLLEDKSNVLVIVRNSFSEAFLSNSIKYKSNKTPKIIRFRSFVKQTLEENFKLIYQDKEPYFIGFSETLYLLKEFIHISKSSFKNNIDRSLVQKIFERMQRKADNNLPVIDLYYKNENIKEIDIFIENFYQYVLSKGKVFLDYSLQLRLLHNLFDDKNFISKFTSNIDLLVIEDIEDAIYSEQLLYEKIRNLIPKVVYSGNPNGGLRRFMGSNPEYLNKLQSQNDIRTIKLNDNNKLKFYLYSESIYKTLKSSEETYTCFSSNSKDIIIDNSIDYGVMLDNLTTISSKLKLEGFKPDDIEIITPELSDIILNQIKVALSNIGWAIESNSSSFMLIKNIRIKNIITILRIAFYPELKEENQISLLNSMDFSSLLFKAGNTEAIVLSKLRNRFGNNSKKYLDFIESYSKKDGYVTLKRIQDCFDYAKENKYNLKTYNEYVDYIRKIDSFINDNKSEDSKEFEVFLEMIETFLDIESNIKTGMLKNPLVKMITNIVNGELSDNPDIYKKNINKVKLLTKQKAAESSDPSKIQIWLDISSIKWLEKNINEISNPYKVAPYFSNTKKDWTYKDENYYQELELGTLLKRLLCLCNERLYLLSCNYNSMGELNSYSFINDFFLEN